MNTVKSIFAVALLLVGLSFIPANAQKADANVTVTKVIDASADEVWSVLRKMDDIDKYSSLIGKVEWTGEHGVGGERLCLPPKNGEGFFKERIVGFDDSQRTYSYALLEGAPVKGMVNNFKVVDLGYQKSMIVWTSTYKQFMRNPNMNEEQFTAFLRQSGGEMIDNVAKTAKKKA